MNEDYVFQTLVASPAVTSLLPPPVDGKFAIYMTEAEQGAPFPRVVVTLVTATPANGFDVPVIDNFLLQIDVYARDRDAMRALAEAVRGALEPEGTMRAILLEEFVPESKLYRRALSFSYWFNRED